MYTYIHAYINAYMHTYIHMCNNIQFIRVSCDGYLHPLVPGHTLSYDPVFWCGVYLVSFQPERPRASIDTLTASWDILHADGQAEIRAAATWPCRWTSGSHT